MKIFILRGCPASGKTTWAKEFIKQNSEYVRLNKDDLRSMFSQKWSKKFEVIVKEAYNILFYTFLQSRQNVILDNTHLSESDVSSIMQFVDTTHIKDVEIEIKDFFDIPLETLIKRDSERTVSVGEKVIRQMWDKQQLLKNYKTIK